VYFGGPPFSDRLARAYDARNRAQLEELAVDLPHRRGLGELLVWAVARMSRLSARIEAAWREPRVPRLALPARSATAIVGRSPDCDWQLTDATVSRRHARLQRCGDRWLLCDLGSTNGTRVNGRRVFEEVDVRPGDRVAFGVARFRLTPPP
jgi:FHA domain